MWNVYFCNVPDPLQVFPDAMHKCYLFLLDGDDEEVVGGRVCLKSDVYKTIV